MIGAGMDVKGAVWKQAAAQIAASAAAGTIIASVVEGAEGVDAASLAQNAVTVGGPIALGAAVASIIVPPSASVQGQMERFLKRGAIAAGVATGVSMYAGIMPTLFDMQTLNYGLVVMGSVYLGDTVANQLQ